MRLGTLVSKFINSSQTCLNAHEIETIDHNIAMFVEAYEEMSSYPWISLTLFTRVELSSFVNVDCTKDLVTVEQPCLCGAIISI